MGFPGGTSGKELNKGDIRDTNSIPGREDTLEDSMETHSHVLACRIP